MVGDSDVVYVPSDAPQRERHVSVLETAGYTVHTAESALDALVRLDTESIQCLVCGGAPPDMPLSRLYMLVQDRHPDCHIFIVGDPGTLQFDAYTGADAIAYVPNEESLVAVVNQALTQDHVDDALAGHHSLTRAVLAIARDLLDASTRDAITRVVYEGLARLDRYQFVWVGDFEPATDRVELQRPTRTTIEATQLASQIGIDEPTFLRRTVSDGTVETTGSAVTARGASATEHHAKSDAPADETSRSLPETLTVAVPFAHDSTVHGFLLLSTHPMATARIDHSERELLRMVGLFVGAAMATAEKNTPLEPEAFADMVVHELVNPLAMAEAALEQGRESGDPDWFDTVERAHTQLTHVLENELALLRGQDIGELTDEDIAADAQAAWETLDPDKAELVIDASHSILADHSLVVRVLANVFDNALSHGGDTVTVRVGPLPDGFYVADDGPGIPATEREQIFEFGYTSGAGTGLGLAIVKRIVDAHGWDITVTNSEADGAKFEITGVEVGENS